MAALLRQALRKASLRAGDTLDDAGPEPDSELITLKASAANTVLGALARGVKGAAKTAVEGLEEREADD